MCVIWLTVCVCMRLQPTYDLLNRRLAAVMGGGDSGGPDGGGAPAAT